MKFLIAIFMMIAMVAAYPERDRRSVLGVPLLAPAVLGPKAAVIGPHGGILAAAAPAVVAAPGVLAAAHGGALIAPGIIAPHIL